MSNPTEQLLREALRERGGDADASNETWAHVVHDGRVRRRARRQRSIAGVAVATAVAAALALFVVVRPNQQTHVVAAPPPVTSLTAEQLRAHDGVGAPHGWVPVDGAGARVWVPGSWSYDIDGQCAHVGSRDGLVSVGRLAGAGCQTDPVPHGYVVPPQSVSLLSISNPSPSDVHPRIVHGYAVYKVKAPAAGWIEYDVPELGVRIALRGSDAARILNTLAPSARTVALATAGQPAPGHWQSVTDEGLSLQVPLSWRVTTPDILGVTAGDGPELERANHANTTAIVTCCAPSELPRASSATINSGGVVYESGSEYGPAPVGAPLAVFAHASATVSVYAGTAYGTNWIDPNVINVFVRHTGSSTAHVLTLDLGRDGRTTGYILASIEADR